MNKRYLMMLKMWLIRSPMKRADYMREKSVFYSMGERVMITSRKIPLYAKLISIGNNVWMASGVEFITHDVVHFMLNGRKDGRQYQEKAGCISIGDNVFIGADAKILYDVKIGNNVIIVAGAVVTKDIQDNSVVGGVPAKVIGCFADQLDKRGAFQLENRPDNRNQSVSDACVEELWKQFATEHQII